MRIHVAEPRLDGREGQYLADVFSSTMLSQGEYVARFERLLAESCGAKHAIAVCNGTAALHLSLVVAGVGPGDEVIVPACTFIATANAVSYTGARPVFVDVDETWCLDPQATLDAVTDHTKAIIPVHLYGLPCDMDPILWAGAQAGAKVIVDAAEAIGAEENGRPVGSTGYATTFSFFANKTCVMGEGGAIVTDLDDVADRMRLYRGQGQTPLTRYWHEVVGYNYRLTDLQAAIGLAQIENLDKHVQARQRVADLYREYLPPGSGFTFQPQPPGRTSSHWMVVVLADDAIDVGRVVMNLQAHGIETRPVFPPLSWQCAYEHLGYRPGQFPVAEKLHQKGIVLPTHGNLSEEDVFHICRTLTETA